MKKQKIKYAVLYCILALIWGILIASLFMGCNVYEHEEVEIIDVLKYRTRCSFPTGNRSHKNERLSSLILTFPPPSEPILTGVVFVFGAC